MKKLLMLLCLSSLLACTNTENKKEPVVLSAEEPHATEEKASTLTLNNGAKWKSDDNTNRNSNELQAIANRLTEKKVEGIADYTSIATDLQTGLDKMIKECRMQGADHEALHKWLEPLLENVRYMKEAKEEKSASEFYGKINERLQIYHQYFE